MSKAEISTLVRIGSGLDFEKAEKVVEAFTCCVQQGLIDEGRVALVGFGSFEIRERKARQGRNPQTGEIIQIKASKNIKFSPGKKLKQAVL